MQRDPRTVEEASPPPPIGVRPATQHMREILEISRAFESHLRTQLTVNSTDLEAMEYLIMNGPTGPGDLARHLELTSAAATTVVDRLVALGHVSRSRNPVDRRGIVVTPSTESTARAMAHIMPMVRGIDEALDDFSPDEQDAITRYLRRVADSYTSHLPSA